MLHEVNDLNISCISIMFKSFTSACDFLFTHFPNNCLSFLKSLIAKTFKF